jgi:hypothetical protein
MLKGLQLLWTDRTGKEMGRINSVMTDSEDKVGYRDLRRVERGQGVRCE